MAVIRNYEDGRTTITVSESDGYFAFSFVSGDTYISSGGDDDEETAIKRFNKSLRAYLAILDKEEEDRVTRSILAEFDIKPV